jgi:hypothetical protein
MKPLEKHDQQAVIKKINELYIQTRRKYLVQLPDNYIALNRDKMENVFPLNDGLIARHLNGVNTYGIFNGNSVNKFITFDVDFADNVAMARWATLKLIDVLVSEFRIFRKDIHVSLSGSKGYHVELFFDKPIAADAAEQFYRKVLKQLPEFSERDIEFRPTWNQGVKLPLGIHQRTRRRCWFVDNQTLEPIKSFDYILNIKPIKAEIILDAVIELTEEQEEEFEKIVRSTDTSITIVDTSKALQKARRILEAGRLTASGTRHNTTFTLACFFNSQGFEREEAVAEIMEILLNTPREYFSKGSTPDFWLKETKRLVDYAYDNDLSLGNAHKEITIYKSDILAVLKVGTFRQKQLAYAMLVTSKRYGRVFYLTVNTAMKMIGTKSRETAQNGIKKLVEVGFIEYVRKGELDRARSKELGRPIYKPNKYRLLIDEPASDEKSIQTKGEDGLVDVAYLLLPAEEIKAYVKRYEFANRWAR